MKKNTLIIIVITAVMLFLGGTALFFGYKYFTIDNKCEEVKCEDVKCSNNVNSGNNGSTTNNNSSNNSSNNTSGNNNISNDNKENCNCSTEAKIVNNMTDSEILRYINVYSGKEYQKKDLGGVTCNITYSEVLLTGDFKSTPTFKAFNGYLKTGAFSLAANFLQMKKNNNTCNINVSYDYAVINGVVVVKATQKMEDKDYQSSYYYYYDVKHDEILNMGDAMRLMGVTDLGGAKNYEDLNNGCSDLTITNHNKVTVSNYREQCA